MRIKYLLILTTVINIFIKSSMSKSSSLYDFYNPDSHDSMSEDEIKLSKVYQGEPFLDQVKSFTDTFYEVLATFSLSAWDGFLEGLYDKNKVE